MIHSRSLQGITHSKPKSKNPCCLPTDPAIGHLCSCLFAILSLEGYQRAVATLRNDVLCDRRIFAQADITLLCHISKRWTIGICGGNSKLKIGIFGQKVLLFYFCLIYMRRLSTQRNSSYRSRSYQMLTNQLDTGEGKEVSRTTCTHDRLPIVIFGFLTSIVKLFPTKGMPSPKKVTYLMSNNFFGRKSNCCPFILVLIHASDMGKSSYSFGTCIRDTNSYIIAITPYPLVDSFGRKTYDIACIVCTGEDFLCRDFDNQSLIPKYLKAYPYITHI